MARLPVLLAVLLPVLVQAGRLAHLLPGWKPVGAFGDAVYAIRPYSPYVPRAVSAFVEHLRRALHAA